MPLESVSSTSVHNRLAWRRDDGVADQVDKRQAEISRLCDEIEHAGTRELRLQQKVRAHTPPLVRFFFIVNKAVEGVQEQQSSQ